MTKKIVLEIKYTIPERMNYQITSACFIERYGKDLTEKLTPRNSRKQNFF